ncbi:hypothetical protein AAHC03_016609 [Spirometra sp. Aus1]
MPELFNQPAVRSSMNVSTDMYGMSQTDPVQYDKRAPNPRITITQTSTLACYQLPNLTIRQGDDWFPLPAKHTCNERTYHTFIVILEMLPLAGFGARRKTRNRTMALAVGPISMC